MKILLCTFAPLTKKLGAPKIYIEFAEELQRMGHQADVIGRGDFAPDDPPPCDGEYQYHLYLSEKLKTYLKGRVQDYDVFDFDYRFF